MLIAKILFVIATLVDSPAALVLRAGNTISVDGALTRNGNRVIFRSGGTLYSLPIDEIDVVATNEREESRRNEANRTAEDRVVRLKKGAAEREKIFAELNDTGKDSPPAPEVRPLPKPSPESEARRREEERREEHYWRQEARAYGDAVERATEELAYLIEREQKLEDEIILLMSLGYTPKDFSLNVYQLDRTRDAIERMKLEVARAQRAFDRFRDDARKAGALPGWLR